MRSIIAVTDAANVYVSSILRSNPGKNLLVGFDNKGCSGHKYTFKLVDDSEIGSVDEKVAINEGTIVVESKSLMGLLGSTLDLKVDTFEQQLVWNNPFAVNQCGCGESFQLSPEKACSK